MLRQHQETIEFPHSLDQTVAVAVAVEIAVALGVMVVVAVRTCLDVCINRLASPHRQSETGLCRHPDNPLR